MRFSGIFHWNSDFCCHLNMEFFCFRYLLICCIGILSRHIDIFTNKIVIIIPCVCVPKGMLIVRIFWHFPLRMCHSHQMCPPCHLFVRAIISAVPCNMNEQLPLPALTGQLVAPPSLDQMCQQSPTGSMPNVPIRLHHHPFICTDFACHPFSYFPILLPAFCPHRIPPFLLSVFQSINLCCVTRTNLFVLRLLACFVHSSQSYCPFPPIALPNWRRINQKIHHQTGNRHNLSTVNWPFPVSGW